jgi:hypothetical protein
MKATNLPTPGILSNGICLRTEAAKAISSLQIAASRTQGGKAAGAEQLEEFFTACAAAAALLKRV